MQATGFDPEVSLGSFLNAGVSWRNLAFLGQFKLTATINFVLSFFLFFKLILLAVEGFVGRVEKYFPLLISLCPDSFQCYPAEVR